MTGTHPLVSVVLPTYNRPENVVEAVQSVAAQLYDRLELIVVDDCSDVPAEDVLSGVSFEGLERVDIVRHDENRGVNAARNTGIEAATGEYIAFLDDDDEWFPEKTARQIEAFANAGSDVGVVYTGTEEVLDGVEWGIKRPPKIEGDITKRLLCRNVVGTLSTPMVRADVAKSTPLDERFPSWADLEWYVALSLKCSFLCLPEPLVRYAYSSPNRISDDFRRSEEAYRLFVDKYRSLSASYGWLFERKMLGWSAFRVGTSAVGLHQYEPARRYLLRAVRMYPFETRFYGYLAASIGGEPTHRVASAIAN